MSTRRTAIAATLAFAAGLAAAHTATDGFQAYTLESARRLNALRSPRPVPDITLELADGSQTRFAAMGGRVLLVDFIYASCPTQCTALGSVYLALQRRLTTEIAAGGASLLSITFDPARDGAGELAAYRARFSPDAPGWDLGRPVSASDLQRALDAFGVVVIPDGMGGYAHNAAVHVVGADGRLVAILDAADVEGAVESVRQALQRMKGRVAAR